MSIINYGFALNIPSLTVGNVNLTGNLMSSSGTTLISSQWLTTAGNLSYTSGSVVIGTRLSAENIISTSSSTGSIISLNSSLGTINSTGLTTGNINFTGNLFQNGIAYIGSQWTTTTSNLSYTSGSVVIETTLSTGTLISTTSTIGNIVALTGISSGSYSGTSVTVGTLNSSLATISNIVGTIGISTGTLNAGNLTTGNINFTGILSQNGIPYVGSQWTTTTSNLSYTSGSVVIETTLSTGTLISTTSTIGNIVALTGISSGAYSGSLATIGNIVASTTISSGTYVGTSVSVGNISVVNFSTSNLQVSGNISAGSSVATIGTLRSSDIFVSGTLTSVNITTTNLLQSSGSLIANNITTESLFTSTISSGNAFLTNLTSANILYTNLTVSNLVANNVNLGISSLYSGSFIAANNVASPTAVTGLIFSSANIRYTEVKVTVTVILSSGGPLSQAYTLFCNYNTSWTLLSNYMGDVTTVVFSIDSSTGQVYYTSSNISLWLSTTIRYSVQQFTNTGTYTSILGNTVGSYILDSVQLNSTTNSVLGTSNGALYVLGGATFGRSVNIQATNVATAVGSGGSLTVFGGLAVSSNAIVGNGITSNLGTNTIGNIYTNTVGNVGIGLQLPNANYILDVGGNVRISGGLTMGSHLIPDTNITYDLGSSTNRWRDLYLSGTTIDLGGTLLKSSSGTMIVNSLQVSTGTLTMSNFMNTSGNMLNSNSVGNRLTTDLKVMNKRIRTSRANAINCASRFTINTLPNSLSWWGVCWSPELGLFAACASNINNNNIFISSPDGINWTTGTGFTGLSTSTYYSICWSSELGLFVASNSNSTNNTTWIVTSTNGITWTQQTGLTSSNGWVGVCWSSELSMFVAVGNGNTARSTNGTTWTVTSNGAIQGRRVCWSPELGLFVAANLVGFMYSSNGTTWTSVTIGSGLVNNTSVCWSPELYLFVGVSFDTSSSLVISRDGINWTIIGTGLTATSPIDVCWSSELSMFLIISISTSVIWSSFDGIKWTSRSIPTTAGQVGVCWSPELSIFCSPAQSNQVIISNIGLSTIKNSINNGMTIINTRLNSTGNMINPTYSTRGNLITTDLKVMNKRIRTSRGNANNSVSTWTTRTLTTSGIWAAISWSPELSLFVVANFNSSSSCQTSPDGINWTARTLGTSIQAWGCCWSSEVGLFIITNVASTTNPFQTSPDGITWTTRTTGSAYGVTGICWSAELGIFVACSTSGVLVSSNGTSWTAYAAGVPASAVNQRICWSAELGIFVLTNASSGFYYSSNGISWTSVAFATMTSIIQSICWSPELGIFVAGSQATTTTNIATSPDGINWTVRSVPAAATGGHNDIIWSQDLSLFITASGSYIFTSHDGINWISRSSSLNSTYTCCWSPELSIFAIISNSTTNVLYTSNYGLITNQNTISAVRSQITVTSSGNVGIGTTSPSFLLDVNGNCRISGSTTLSSNPANVLMGGSKVHNKYSIIAATSSVELTATDFNLKFKLSGSNVWQIGTISGTASTYGGTQRFYSGTNASSTDNGLSLTTTFQDIVNVGSGNGGDKFLYTFTMNDTSAYTFTGMTNFGYTNLILIVEKLV